MEIDDVDIFLNKFEGEAASGKPEEIEWTTTTELALLTGIDGLKPVGFHKEMLLSSITGMVCRDMRRPITATDIWQQIQSIYNTDMLDEWDESEREDNNHPVTFTLPDTDPFTSLTSRYAAAEDSSDVTDDDDAGSSSRPHTPDSSTSDTNSETPTAAASQGRSSGGGSKQQSKGKKDKKKAAVQVKSKNPAPSSSTPSRGAAESSRRSSERGSSGSGSKSRSKSRGDASSQGRKR